MSVLTGDRGIPALLGRLAEGLGHLMSEHITLARLEVTEDARVLGKDLGRLAAFIPFMVVGYALCCVAAAVVLTPVMGLAGGFLLVGGLNFVGGGLGFFVAFRKFSHRRPMEESMDALSDSASALAGNPSQLTLENRQ